MNAIGEGATPLMYACQQSRDQDVRTILAKKVAYLPHPVHFTVTGNTTCRPALGSMMRNYAASRKVAGSRPTQIIEFFFQFT
jgi:hypothetical protein